MAYNYSKLIGRIIEKYGTRGAFARAMGFTQSTLSSKLASRRDFTQTEIFTACKLLCIPEEEMKDYFFTV